jgi:hypothetical protein
MLLREETVELAGALNRLCVGADDDVAEIDAGLLGWRVWCDVHYQETMLLIGVGTGTPFLRQRNFLHGDPKVGLRDVAAFQQFVDHTIDSFGGQGNDRRACKDRTVDAQQLAATVDEGAAGLAGIEADIGAKEAVDLSAAPRLPRSADTSDDSGAGRKFAPTGT